MERMLAQIGIEKTPNLQKLRNSDHKLLFILQRNAKETVDSEILGKKENLSGNEILGFTKERKQKMKNQKIKKITKEEKKKMRKMIIEFDKDRNPKVAQLGKIKSTKNNNLVIKNQNHYEIKKLVKKNFRRGNSIPNSKSENKRVRKSKSDEEIISQKIIQLDQNRKQENRGNHLKKRDVLEFHQNQIDFKEKTQLNDNKDKIEKEIKRIRIDTEN